MIKCSLLAYVPIAIVAGAGAVGIAVAPLMGATVGILPEDLHERLMLGDTGANVLGGILGLVVVLECDRTTRNIVLVVLVVAEPRVRVRVVQRGDREGAAACAGSISWAEAGAAAY